MNGPGTPDIVAFTSESTAEDCTIMLGYVPVKVIVWADTGATNPDIYTWYDKTYANGLADGDSLNDSAFKLTGSTGVVTVVDDAIFPHEGGTTITSSNDENFRLTDTGLAPAPADYPKSLKGITIDATIQGDDNHIIVECYRGNR